MMGVEKIKTLMRVADQFMRAQPLHADRVQGVSSTQAKSLLVDTSKTRRKIVESEELSYGYDSGVGRRRRYPGAHSVQGNLFPDIGRFVLGKGQRL